MLSLFQITYNFNDILVALYIKLWNGAIASEENWGGSSPLPQFFFQNRFILDIVKNQSEIWHKERDTARHISNPVLKLKTKQTWECICDQGLKCDEIDNANIINIFLIATIHDTRNKQSKDKKFTFFQSAATKIH